MRCGILALDMESIRAFAMVAELGSFNDAARALNLSAPALTRRVQKLEAGLETELLKRTTRKVELTLPGRDFLARVRKLIDEFDATLSALRDVSARRTARITIACIPTVTTFLVPRAVFRFGEQFPDVRVRIIEENANSVVQRVIRHEADVGITFLGGHSSDLEYYDVHEEPYVLVCRNDHELAAQTEVAWRDLAPYRLITSSRLSGNRLVIDQALQRHGFKPNWFYEVQHLPTSLGLVEAGLALVVVPELMFPNKIASVLVSRRLVDPRVKRTVRVIRRRDPDLSRTAEAFVQIVRRASAEAL